MGYKDTYLTSDPRCICRVYHQGDQITFEGYLTAGRHDLGLTTCDQVIVIKAGVIRMANVPTVMRTGDMFGIPKGTWVIIEVLSDHLDYHGQAE